MFLKAWPLCTNTRAESNLGDRVLDEIEKDSFIPLSSKGRHIRPLPQKPIPRRLMTGIPNKGSELSTKLMIRFKT